VAFVSDFVSAEFAASLAQGEGNAPSTMAPKVTVEHVADHIEHIRDVAGIDHVGIGADFDGSPHMPSDLADVSCYPLLMNALAGRGWSPSDLERLASGNILRVLRAAEDTAERR